MSRENIRQRATDVQRHWSSSERSRRVEASRLRCTDLLFRITAQREPILAVWQSKTTR